MKRMRGRSILVFSVMWLLSVDAALADSTRRPFGVFEMLEGQGVEVCEACLKAFEAIASGPDGVGLSGCERNYSSEYGLSAPQWTELPPLKHLSLLKEVMLFLMPLDPESYIGTGRSSMFEGTIYETDDMFRREITGELKYERIAIAQTNVDIDNDGRPDPLFTYRSGYCTNPQAPAPSRALVVLTQDRKSIDKAKTDVVTQNELKEKRRPAGNDSSKIYDVFAFKGQIYFDKWDRSPDPDIVTVYQAKGKKVTTLCKFRYEIPYRPPSLGGKP